MRRTRASLVMTLIVSGVLVVTGALVILVAPQASPSFGWSDRAREAPLSRSKFDTVAP